MLNGQLPMLAEHIVVGMIMSPHEELITTNPADSAREAYAMMGDLYDQLPVINNGLLAGMLFRNQLTEDDDRKVGDCFAALSEISSIQNTASIWEAMNCLAHSTSCVVFDAKTGAFTGLLHFADLNRQAVRVFCYLWTSALEMSLAELLQLRRPNDLSWIESLSPHRQVQVLGRHEYSKRQKIELSPVEGLELSDLLNIWPKHDDLLNLFEMSKTEFSKKTNHLVELRNIAMHPVRSLLNTGTDVQILNKRMRDLREMVQKSIEIIQK